MPPDQVIQPYLPGQNSVQPEPNPVDSTANTVAVAEPPAKENIYTEICSQIIKEQQQIIGNIAIEQAQMVVGLSVDPTSLHCTVEGDGSKVINDLIENYREFFGNAAVEVCKEAVSGLVNKLPDNEKPYLLR
jgi:hypothetical protein